MRTKQTERVLSALKAGRVLDRLSAWTDIGVPKLPSRVSELIAEGHPINKAWKTVYNRYGEKCNVKCYWIARGEK